MEQLKTMVYVLFMDNYKDGVVTSWDVFGVYSTREKAEEAMKWRKRKDGLYEGCRPDLLYNRCGIDTRIIDYNLPD